ncbi:glycosyltransferase [Sandaracinomonas limnophila]|uniref:Glycosyltransferase n=1 Tax=Sandaracinomonas limnophila TaxID=1862386 RepID=A0A437PTL7_9BACT|nr:glycosyltransferase [Sandaracinomonas limnophila]RVU25596.1 glycosyltransferase [Sandaracinomonas limnophila]
MKIWLVTIGEPIFHPDNKLRLHRTGILSKYILENRKDVDVTWWTSTFSHFTKKQIFENTIDCKIGTNFKMIAINGGGYRKNVSFERIRDHNNVNEIFKKKILEEEKPDIIVSAFPTIGLCESAIAYAKINNIPILIDYRDLWPEVYIDLIPKPFKFLGKILLYPLIRRVNNIFLNATGVLGVTEGFLSIALRKAKRKKNQYDAVFPLGYLKNQYSEAELIKADNYWGTMLSNRAKLRICFFGAIGYQSDWDTIVTCIKIAFDQKLPVEFVICGSGDRLNELVSKTQNLDNVHFPGFVSASQIYSLMKLSDFGLCAFLSKENYLNAIPGKSIEYMSAGLPILNSLKNSELGQLITDFNIGFNYDDADSFLSVIKLALNSKFDKSQLKNNINKIYNNNFDSTTVYKNYLSHIENCISFYSEKKLKNY